MRYHIREGTDAWRAEWAVEVDEQRGSSFRTTKTVIYTEEERLQSPHNDFYVFELPSNEARPWKFLIVRIADVTHLRLPRPTKPLNWRDEQDDTRLQ